MNKTRNYYHKELAGGRWQQLSLVEQMANIGSEVFRTISWRNKGNDKLRTVAFERTLELADLTIEDPKNIDRLKEITRMREVLVDYFFGNNIYGSCDRSWERYFYPFNLAARAGH
ncbi:MAG: hypothetical protein NT099_08320 [Candidatus Saganbacteria bacterium]|nr:hypothetical protein [Candidatus Saganbacteria bacterium]